MRDQDKSFQNKSNLYSVYLCFSCPKQKGTDISTARRALYNDDYQKDTASRPLHHHAVKLDTMDSSFIITAQFRISKDSFPGFYN
ncbi:hypothetical protein [Candidatus Nitrosocosmicus sp. R]